MYSRDQLMHLATSPLATILSSTPPQGLSSLSPLSPEQLDRLMKIGSLSNFPDLLRSNQKAAVGTTDQTDRSPSKLAQQPQQQKQKQAAPPATTEESELQFAMD